MPEEKSHLLMAIRLLQGRNQHRLLQAERARLEQRLHRHLDRRCIVTLKGNEIHVEIVGRFTKSQLHHKASGARRVREWGSA